MKLADVRKTLQAEVLCGVDRLDDEVGSACGADLMSDVLVHSREKTLLLTGLTNVQIIRTAEVGDLAGIVMVRGKRPGPDVVQMAVSKGIPLMVTKLPMFEACGILYSAGLKGCSELVITSES